MHFFILNMKETNVILVKKEDFIRYFSAVMKQKMRVVNGEPTKIRVAYIRTARSRLE